MLKARLLLNKILNFTGKITAKFLISEWNFQDTFETSKRSFISAFSIFITVPLIHLYLTLWQKKRLQNSFWSSQASVQLQLFFKKIYPENSPPPPHYHAKHYWNANVHASCPWLFKNLPNIREIYRTSSHSKMKIKCSYVSEYFRTNQD